jgi:hypothetical protein
LYRSTIRPNAAWSPFRHASTIRASSSAVSILLPLVATILSAGGLGNEKGDRRAAKRARSIHETSLLCALAIDRHVPPWWKRGRRGPPDLGDEERWRSRRSTGLSALMSSAALVYHGGGSRESTRCAPQACLKSNGNPNTFPPLPALGVELGGSFWPIHGSRRLTKIAPR